ncbi:MAG: penicillin-binding protein 2 [Marinilabiliaceae bacterium]|nr:penicillin-binding protein 2 [Marinilabiliaceae bacterium]
MEYRRHIIAFVMILIGLCMIARLAYVQLFDSTYKLSADSNSRRKVTQYPSRGLIYDRNGKLLVSNEAYYDIMVVPREVHEFDSLDFCQTVGIDMPMLRDLFKEMRLNIRRRRASVHKPYQFIRQLSSERYAVLQEKLYRLDGFYAQRRTLRKYEYPAAAHVLGYVGEVNENVIKNDPYYAQGDYIGISGIESSFESDLRGQKGVNYLMVDVLGRQKGEFRGGAYDTVAISGKDLTLSLDIELQMYGERLMAGKTGSIVAIKPQTGEILCMVSAPSYDPSLLIGRDRSVNFPLLSSDPQKPLFNRAIQAWYPPGSTFKTINALIGMQEGVVTPETRYPCAYGYTIGRFHMGCHGHASPLNLRQSIQNSCNGYYAYEFRAILDNKKYESVGASLDNWKDYLVRFGLGYRLGIDIANENRGFVPNAAYYDKAKGKGWTSLGVVSLSIGQGELLLTPIQMANVAAIISNKGWFYTPHVVHHIEETDIASQYTTKHFVGIDTTYFSVVQDGMEMAVWGTDGGTARAAQIPDIRICGKTGTAQNPHGKDHSIFMSFAPKDDPQIAISVYVENAGFGATWAAPIASLMVEKYVNGSIKPEREYIEKRILETQLNGVQP